MKKLMICLAAGLLLAACAPKATDAPLQPERLDRVEPPCWWVGMKTPLQLLVKGEGIGAFDVRIEGGKGVKVDAVHKAESPNYLFVDVRVDRNAAAGSYKLVFSRGDECFAVPYELAARKEGSAGRKGFGNADAIYLIMPDRFANGDPSNDNSPETREAAAPEAFFGRHGGDIRGIRDHLDYIADLGFTAIWNTPLLEDDQPRQSYHGYACTNYYRIDPRFGSNEDYRDLVEEAHQHGIKMIMDVVTNHCGSLHWWMADLPFADWIHQWPTYTQSNYIFSTLNDPYAAQIDRTRMEEGWFDRSMADMNLDNPYLLKYFQDWGVWWVEWAGLDGFRVDTYPYNEKEPMSQWCAAILNEYPALNIVGEVWSNNVPQVAYWQANPNKDGFNSNLPSIMDFCLMSAIGDGIGAEHGNISRIYDSMANDLYFHDPMNMMIFPGNHDTDRIGDVVGEDPAKMKLVMTLMATLRGYPQVFAGDELMVVSKDRSQGHGGLRVEFPDDWAENPVRKDLHDYFRTLLRWRQTSAAVQEGATLHFNGRNTYSYFRYTDKEAVFVFLNNNEAAREIPWADYAEFTGRLSGAGRNVVTGETVDFSKPQTVEGKSALVVEFK